MRKVDIKQIAEMLKDGYSPDEIGEIISEIEADDQAHRREYEMMYGDDYNDAHAPSPYQAAINDRLDMGQNEAGEWIGFM